MTQKILVTGGAGYIGAILIPTLLAHGYQVTVLDNFMYRQTSLLDVCAHPQFSVVRGDCRDERVLREALRDAGCIIPLAALVGAPLCDRDVLGATSTNLDAIRLLLRLRSPQQRILFPNTNSGYGVGEPGTACTEDSLLRPVSLYGRTKVDAERALLDAGNVVCFRLATVFGMSPRMRLDLLVNDFVHRAVHDSALVIFQGHFKRNYVHVRDVADAFLHGLTHFEAMRDRTYNLGLDDANLSKLELCAAIKRFLPRFTYLEAPIGEDPDQRNYAVSNERLRQAGFVASRSLHEGIVELIKGYTILSGRQHANV